MNPSPSPQDRAVRNVADSYVQRLAELDPIAATYLGVPLGQDRLPDFSPGGQQAYEELWRSVLAELSALEQQAETAGGFANDDERRCARLLRERLESELAAGEAGEHLRSMSNIAAPPHYVREAFLLMPAKTPDEWAVIARRIGAVPDALSGYRAALGEGARRGLRSSPRLVRAMAEQLAQWRAAENGRGWFTEFAAQGDAPASLHADLDRAGPAADTAVDDLCRWLLSDYLPGAEGTPDGAGADRYQLGVRRWNGARLDLAETYEWGWSQFRQILAEMTQEAAKILPGSTLAEAYAYLNADGDAVEGVEEIRAHLQRLMDKVIADLDGKHFDLPGPVKVVQAMIAPAGSSAAAYYTPPSKDFSRPGRTWLPTLGETRFPLWRVISTWYHEGVPGHHLQIAQWCYLASQLSEYQTMVGDVSACSEGWALYAERLMDELGYLQAPGARLGYLDAQLLRAIRVVVDIGLHLELTVPADSPMFAGLSWTPERAVEFFAAHNGEGRQFADSEIIRYLGLPGQAISYKVGERAWLAGRDAARAAHGPSFDLKSWHMAALSLGSLGLDDMVEELAKL